ncbi:MAG: cupin domain-containing protein [Pseudomonadales bacterium]
MKKTLKTLVLCGVIASTAAIADSGLMTQLDDRKWTQINGTPMSFSMIWGDRDTGPYAMYLKLPAGFSASEHAHTYSYRGITLQGQWQHSYAGERKTLGPGGYVFQPGNAWHADSCTGKQDCILMIQQDGKGDAHFPHSDH